MCSVASTALQHNTTEIERDRVNAACFRACLLGAGELFVLVHESPLNTGKEGTVSLLTRAPPPPLSISRSCDDWVQMLCDVYLKQRLFVDSGIEEKIR